MHGQHVLLPWAGREKSFQSIQTPGYEDWDPKPWLEHYMPMGLGAWFFPARHDDLFIVGSVSPAASRLLATERRSCRLARDGCSVPVYHH